MDRDRKDSVTQMTDLNQRMLDQTNQIKAITKVANSAQDTSDNILRQLGGQRQKIQKNIDISKQTKQQLKYSDKIVNQMRRRALCMKCTMWVTILVLFALIVALLVWKLNKK